MSTLAPDRTDPQVLAASSPAGFAHVCSQGKWIPYDHLILLNDYLLRVVDGEINRLAVFMPPRFGKSVLISQYLPAWYLGTFPDREVMLASYQGRFAAGWGRKARQTLDEHGLEVFSVRVAAEPRAADWWMVNDHDGVMVTSGLEGSMTGKGAHLLIIDDPVKDAQDAASEVFQQKQLEWWQSTASSRLMPGGAVVLVMTRWNENDLAGQLLARHADRWTVLTLPAIAEENDQLGRPEGELLCPELFDKEEMDTIKEEKGSYYFAAMYQQRPAPPEGFLFKKKDLRYWREDSRMIGAAEQRLYVLADDDGPRIFDMPATPRFQTVDAAISEKETADFTVVATWALTEHGDLILLDLERKHFEEAQVIQFLAAANDKHGRPPMWIERFGAGRNPLARLREHGRPVMEIPAEAGTQVDKITRAFGAVALCERHRLFLPANRPDWLGAFEIELFTFPNGAHDDMVDTLAYAARLIPIVHGGEIRAQRSDGPRPHTSGVRREQF